MFAMPLSTGEPSLEEGVCGGEEGGDGEGAAAASAAAAEAEAMATAVCKVKPRRKAPQRQSERRCDFVRGGEGASGRRPAGAMTPRRAAKVRAARSRGDWRDPREHGVISEFG